MEWSNGNVSFSNNPVLLLPECLCKVSLSTFCGGTVFMSQGPDITKLHQSNLKLLMAGLSKSKANFSGMNPLGGPWVFFVCFYFFVYFYF